MLKSKVDREDFPLYSINLILENITFGKDMVSLKLISFNKYKTYIFFIVSKKNYNM